LELRTNTAIIKDESR